MEKENRYIKLSRQDVSAGVEHKGGLSYLSWAYCWNKVSSTTIRPTFFSLSRRGTRTRPSWSRPWSR